MITLDCARMLIRGKVSMHVESVAKATKGGIKKYVAEPNAGGETKFMKVFRKKSVIYCIKDFIFNAIVIRIISVCKFNKNITFFVTILLEFRI